MSKYNNYNNKKKTITVTAHGSHIVVYLVKIFVCTLSSQIASQFDVSMYNCNTNIYSIFVLQL